VYKMLVGKAEGKGRDQSEGGGLNMIVILKLF
jgi:hypothetical protein